MYVSANVIHWLSLCLFRRCCFWLGNIVLLMYRVLTISYALSGRFSLIYLNLMTVNVCLNTDIAVNVLFWWWRKAIYPLYETSECGRLRHIIPLSLMDGVNYHYVLIEDMSAWVSHQSAYSHKTFACDYCLYPCSSVQGWRHSFESGWSNSHPFPPSPSSFPPFPNPYLPAVSPPSFPLELCIRRALPAWDAARPPQMAELDAAALWNGVWGFLP
jgi:hypothetical protein